MTRRIFALLCTLGLLPHATAMAAEAARVVMRTSLGDITLELDRVRAPVTVDNFLGYVEEGFYDGTVFHRVIDGFMIQGGGLTHDLQRKSAKEPIQNEADNGLKNLLGTIAMARTSDPHSATAQFFINVADNAFLDHKAPTARGWGYAVFGRVLDGMDTVDRIRVVETGARGPYRDVPSVPVVIESIDVVSN